MHRILVLAILLILAAACTSPVPDYAAKNDDYWLYLDTDSIPDVAISLKLRGDTTIGSFVLLGDFLNIIYFDDVEISIPGIDHGPMSCELSDGDGTVEWMFEGKSYKDVLAQIQSSQTLSDTSRYVLDCECNFNMKSFPDVVDMNYKIKWTDQLFEGIRTFEKYETDTAMSTMRWH